MVASNCSIRLKYEDGRYEHLKRPSETAVALCLSVPSCDLTETIDLV